MTMSAQTFVNFAASSQHLSKSLELVEQNRNRLEIVLAKAHQTKTLEHVLSAQALFQVSWEDAQKEATRFSREAEFVVTDVYMLKWQHAKLDNLVTAMTLTVPYLHPMCHHIGKIIYNIHHATSMSFSKLIENAWTNKEVQDLSPSIKKAFSALCHCWEANDLSREKSLSEARAVIYSFICDNIDSPLTRLELLLEIAQGIP
jgi:hypothetical protein